MIIDSSICVATTTGRPSRRDASTMRFCSGGTVCGGSSTPRSPRATITPSHCSTISSSRSIAAGFSILASSAALPPISLPRLRQILGPLDERQRDPVDALLEREGEVAAVLLGQRRHRHAPRRGRSAPCCSTARRRPRPASRSGRRRAPSTRSTSLPSSSSSRAPGSIAAKISRCGSSTRVASPGVGDRDRA